MPTNPSAPINRLILIGNGFDLAHKMKTSYGDFILWYFQESWNEAKETFRSRDFHINALSRMTTVFSNDLFTIMFDKDSFSDIDVIPYFTYKEVQKIFGLGHDKPYKNIIQIQFKSNFFITLINEFFNKNWVDIENNYYGILTKIINNPNKNLTTGETSFPHLEILNKNFDIIKKALETYLTTLPQPDLINNIADFIYEKPINPSHLEHMPQELANTMFLNFNYTSTPELYKKENTDIIYIHGELDTTKNNPIIFGYGDEWDESYSILEKANIQEVFKHIKSFDYLQTNNYSRMLAFLEAPFDVYIMGHSCGLSDRTLLSTIFEHDNCRLIKIFFYENMERYRETTYEISRHFTSKAEMRRKVINFADCSPMPQLPS